MKPSNLSLLTFGLSFILCVAISNAQELNKQVDALLAERYPTDGPGAVAIVAKGGKPIFRKAYGMADLERTVAMTPEHIFEIGSITKQFTVVAILMLMEQGKLSLQDPITKFVKEYPTHGHNITVHHLLTHTSGIKSYTSLEKWTKIWRQDMTTEEMMDLFKNEPMDFAPGEQERYNNSAYFLAGVVIEKASGLTYPDFIRKNIFEPLKMSNTYYGSRSQIIKNRALGYQKGETFINAEYLSHTQPFAAGSIMSTVDDLLTWNNAVQSYQLVKKESLDKAFTNYKLNNGKPTNYGYGWALNEINGSPTREHSGGIFGYTSNGIYLPNEDVYVAVLSNCDCAPPGEVSTKMAALAIGKPYPMAVAKIKLDEAYANSLAGVYDFEDESSRIITYEDGKMYSQRSGSQKFEIFPLDKSNFIFEGFASIRFTIDKKGKVEAMVKNRIDVTKGVKTDKPIPKRVEISVGETTLKQYVGVYELQPGFDITITVEDSRLMSQATGQQKFEVFPESSTKFFLKVVDAQLEFVAGEGGKFSKLILYQGGRQLEGKRKE